MGAFTYAAGVGVVDKLFVEVRVEDAIDGMVEKSIAYRCFVNVTRLRITYLEGFVGTVIVYLTLQVTMEVEDVVHEARLEVLHILFLTLSADEFLQCFKEILD